jgi:hypothetical protein
MELLLLLLLIAILPLVGLWRMLFGRGPNSWQRLIRLDLAALLVLTAGVALALAIVRRLNPWEAACILVLALPAMIAFAWLGRYALEELVLGFHRRQDRHKRSADLAFLSEPPGDTVEATLVEQPTTDSLNGEPQAMPLPREEGLA